MELLPYKQSPASQPTDSTPDGVTFWSSHKALRSGALELPASGALAQSVSASGLHPEGSGFEFREPHQPRKLTDAERVVGYILLTDAADYLRAAYPWLDGEAHGEIAKLRRSLIEDSACLDGILAVQDHLTSADCTRWKMWRHLVSAEVGS